MVPKVSDVPPLARHRNTRGRFTHPTKGHRITDNKRFAHMTPAEYGRMLAEQEALIIEAQAEAARILVAGRRDSRVPDPPV